MNAKRFIYLFVFDCVEIEIYVDVFVCLFEVVWYWCDDLGYVGEIFCWEVKRLRV